MMKYAMRGALAALLAGIGLAAASAQVPDLDPRDEDQIQLPELAEQEAVPAESPGLIDPDDLQSWLDGFMTLKPLKPWPLSKSGSPGCMKRSDKYRTPAPTWPCTPASFARIRNTSTRLR